MYNKYDKRREGCWGDWLQIYGSEIPFVVFTFGVNGVYVVRGGTLSFEPHFDRLSVGAVWRKLHFIVAAVGTTCVAILVCSAAA